MHPVPVYDELAEIVRQEEISQTRVARQILQSPALCRMVDAVLSKNSIAPEAELRAPRIKGEAGLCEVHNGYCALGSHEIESEYQSHAGYAAWRE